MQKGDERPNIIVIMSDEHDPNVTGCYGHPMVRTPHLDRLAEEGVLFDNAYCNSPMCGPSRMSFLTGKYAHRIGAWDNGSILRSEIPTFANYFEAAGYRTTLCGRMHMIGENRLHGFEQRLYEDKEDWKSPKQTPLRVKESRRSTNSHVTQCGPGTGSWQEYDRNVADLSLRFLEAKAKEDSREPWLLVSGFMFPHFPLIAPQQFYDLYDPADVPLPDLRDETFASQHPVIQHLRYCFRNDEALSEEIQRKAIASYYALVSLTDHYVGQLIDVVNHSRLKENTVIIYLSDHGEMGGQHGIWQKQCFYESSVRVPIIMRMPGGPKGTRVKSNVSLIDIAPTMMELAGIRIPEHLDGESLLGMMYGKESPDRTVLSEYHAQGMLNGGFMVKKGAFKYNYYVGHAPELYHTEKDPGEFMDLSCDPTHRDVMETLDQELHQIADPEQVDKQAKECQDRFRK